ncbi:hypothetical protein QJS66_07140 [Kocuria rhizophila]|nr:hypothetical protein QJS66_07140 [Kocuria rhizophila]
MAVNLVKAGGCVTAFDVVPTAMDTTASRASPSRRPRRTPCARRRWSWPCPVRQRVKDACASGGEVVLAASTRGATFLDCSAVDISEAQEAGPWRGYPPRDARSPGEWWVPLHRDAG